MSRRDYVSEVAPPGVMKKITERNISMPVSPMRLIERSIEHIQKEDKERRQGCPWSPRRTRGRFERTCRTHFSGMVRSRAPRSEIGLALLITLSVNMAGLSSAEESIPLSLSDLRVPYEHKNGIYVITGSGEKILSLLPERVTGTEAKKARKVKHAYYQPDVHPTQERLICVRCNDFSLQVLTDVRSCELIEVSLNGENPLVRSIYTPPGGYLIESPVWSPDGNRIAFLMGNNIWRLHERIAKGERKPFNEFIRTLGILDKESGVVEWIRIEIMEKALPHFSALKAGRRGYIRWDADGTRIFIYARRPGPRQAGKVVDVGEVDVAARKFRWLDMSDIMNYGKPYHGHSTPYHPGSGYLYTRKKLPDFPAVRALFGSSDNTVFRPVWSPDRRYFFYKRRKEGWGAKAWIECYDTRTQKRVEIKTLWWAPYVE